MQIIETSKDYVGGCKNAAEPNSPLRFGANALGQQAGIWFGLSALTQIAFIDFRYPPAVIPEIIVVEKPASS